MTSYLELDIRRWIYILLFANINEQSVLAFIQFQRIKTILIIENDFEENKSISDYRCLVKSSREYFGNTAELRVSSGLFRNRPYRVELMIQIKESGSSLYSRLYSTKPGMHCKLWWRRNMYQSV